MRHTTKTWAATGIAAFLIFTSGCSGGSSSADNANSGANGSVAGTGGSSSSGAAILGIATPTNVSVVTATNVQ